MKFVTKFSSILTICLLCTFDGFAQVSKVETFEGDVFLNQVYEKDLLGNQVSGKSDGGTIDYEDFQGIHPNSGQWFSLASTNTPDFGIIETGGNTDKFLGRITGNKFGKGVVYIFNNSEYAVKSSFTFSFDYFFEVTQTDRVAYRVYGFNQDGTTPLGGYTKMNQGSGAFGDNQSCEWKGAPAGEATVIAEDTNLDGPTGGWQSVSVNVDFSGNDYEWIYIGFGVAYNTDGIADEDGPATFGLDNVVIPFIEGVVDQMAPVITDYQKFGSTDPVDSAVVFASERSTVYLVPLGTAGDKTAIEAASLASSDEVNISRGALLEYNGVANGDYLLYAIDPAGNVSAATEFMVGPDLVAPVIEVAEQEIEFERSIEVTTSSENATLYLVPSTTEKVAATIKVEALVSSSVSKDSGTEISLVGIASGTYKLYALDDADNVSVGTTIIHLAVDEFPPLVEIGSQGLFEVGGNLNFKVNEKAMTFVVPANTTGDSTAIAAASLVSAEVTDFASTIIVALPGAVVEGTYWLYAVDLVGNISEPKPFTVLEAGLKFRTETFDGDLFLNELFAPSVTGDPVVDNGRGNTGDWSINYDMLRGIHPGSGQWFASPNSFAKVADGGNTGGYVGRSDNNNFGRGIMYMYNNEDHAINSSVEMSFDYIFEVEQADRFAITVYGAKKNENGTILGVLRTNQGSGGAGDNQAAQWKGEGEEGSNSGDATQIYQEWGFDGPTGGWTNHTFTADFSADQYDFIFVCFGVAFNSMPADGSLAFGIDNLTLPFQAGAVDDLAPFLRKDLVLMGDTAFGVFASEAAIAYLVPQGTEATEKAILRDSVLSTTTVISTGNRLDIKDITPGAYELYIIDDAGNVSVGKHVNVGDDVTGPLITNVGPGDSNPQKTDIMVTTDEEATVYLVPTGTSAVEADIIAASVSSVALSEKVAGILGTDVAVGSYHLFAIDTAGNVSNPKAYTVEILDLIAPVFSSVSTIVEPGGDITFTVDEFATVHFVPEGTAADVASIQAASLGSVVVQDPATAGKISTSSSQALGNYLLYALDVVLNVSLAQTITLADLSGPVAIEISGAEVVKGDNIRVVFDEDGIVYVVPAGTAQANVATASLGNTNVTAGLPSFINTGGTDFAVGSTYDIYGKDNLDNWSGVLASVTLIDLVLGLDNSLSFSIYPNPASNQIRIKGFEDLKIDKIEMFDLSGKLQMTKGSSFDMIDISGLQSGVYLLKIHTGDQVLIHRIAKID